MMTQETPFWFQCPQCKGRGNVDRDQYVGKVSIICSNCDWHGHKDMELTAALHAYLNFEVGLYAVQEWIARQVSELPVKNREQIDEVARQLAHLDAGESDEEHFRSQMILIRGSAVILS